MKKELMKSIIQWDVKSWSEPLIYWEQHVDWSKVCHGLELGGREGGLSLWLALKGIKTVCSDLHNVENTARHLHAKYDVDSMINYQDIDATSIPYENHFDVILFKSIIGGIGRGDDIEKQRKVFQQIYKALKPGGKLLYAENLSASAVHQKFRKRFVSWGNTWRYPSSMEMKEFLKDFKSVDFKTTGILGAFGRTEKQRFVLSSIDQLFLNKISADHWKYIGYGIAVK